MKTAYRFSIITILLLLFSCGVADSPEAKAIAKNKEQLQGKWFYGMAPQSYTEITGDEWTDNLGEINVIVKSKMRWLSATRIELEVTESNAPINMMAVGYKHIISLTEIRDDLLQYNTTTQRGTPECIYLLRSASSSSLPGTPC